MKLYSFAVLLIFAAVALSAADSCLQDADVLGGFIDKYAAETKPGTPEYNRAMAEIDAAEKAKKEVEPALKALSADNVNRGDGIDTSALDKQIEDHPKSYKPYYAKAALQVAAGKHRTEVDDTLDGAIEALQEARGLGKNEFPTELRLEGREYYLQYLATALTAATSGGTTFNRVRTAFCAQLKYYKETFGAYLTSKTDSKGDVYYRLRTHMPTTTAINLANCQA